MTDNSKRTPERNAPWGSGLLVPLPANFVRSPRLRQGTLDSEAALAEIARRIADRKAEHVTLLMNATAMLAIIPGALIVVLCSFARIS